MTLPVSIRDTTPLATFNLASLVPLSDIALRTPRLSREFSNCLRIIRSLGAVSIPLTNARLRASVPKKGRA
jgi:hypothetical protein